MGPVLLSPHKMKLLFLALLAAFAVSVKAVGCDCSYFPVDNLTTLPTGGCKITTPADRPWTACRCLYSHIYVGRCTGTTIRCLHPKCENPGTSLEDCRLGGGNCGGY